MHDQQFPRLRVYLTLWVTLAELANLVWEHFNGGVVIHHIMDRSDMPAVSNWWSGLLIPVLTWFLMGRIQARIVLHSDGEQAASRLSAVVAAGFVGSLLFGILISVSFTSGYEALSSFLFPSMVLLALIFPGYRAECVLGFVLGMTFTFGAVLPAAVGSLIAIVSAVIHLWIRPVLVQLWSRFKRA